MTGATSSFVSLYFGFPFLFPILFHLKTLNYQTVVHLARHSYPRYKLLHFVTSNAICLMYPWSMMLLTMVPLFVGVEIELPLIELSIPRQQLFYFLRQLARSIFRLKKSAHEVVHRSNDVK